VDKKAIAKKTKKHINNQTLFLPKQTTKNNALIPQAK